MRKNFSNRTTASWPELFESAQGRLWTSPKPEISWGALLVEADIMRSELASCDPASWPPPSELGRAAVEGLRGLVSDFSVAELENLHLDALHPRFLAVFLEQPGGKRLLERLKGLVKWQMKQKRGIDVPDEQAENGAFVELFRHHQMLQWAHYGRRVYMLGSHTASLLAQTDLPNMPVSDLAFPFPGFYIRLPGWMYEMRAKTTRISVDGILITTDHTAHAPNLPREIQIQLCPDRAFGVGEASPRALWTGPANSPIREIAADLQLQLLEPGGSFTPLAGLYDPIPNLVFCFLLYLSSDHPLLEPVPSPLTGERQTGSPGSLTKPLRPTHLTRIGFVRVGGDDPPIGSDRPSGTPLSHLVWVRGHWRLQAHGPQFSLRKQIWIEPHVRGPDVADQVTARSAYVQDARPTDSSLSDAV